MLILVGENIEEGYFYYFDTDNKNTNMVLCIKPPYMDEPEPVEKLSDFRRNMLDTYIISDNKPFDDTNALVAYAKERYNYTHRQMQEESLSIYDDDFLKYMPKECAEAYIERIKELITEIVNEKGKMIVCSIFLKQLSRCLSIKNDYELKSLQQRYDGIIMSLRTAHNKNKGPYCNGKGQIAS